MKKGWKKWLTFLTIISFLALPAAALAKTQIIWWHAMTGYLGQRVNEIAAKFNASQSEYEVKPVHKGSYAETLTAGIAAYRAKHLPISCKFLKLAPRPCFLRGRFILYIN
jgi:sn-glycerol 3-phosphate transport system substrate-binding protein